MTAPTRFDEIASRARRSRVRDAAFALFMAGLLALGIGSLRETTLTAQPGSAVRTASQTGVAATPTVCDLTVC